MKIKRNPAVQAKFKSYPKDIRPKMDYLRELILETAGENPDITEIEETLKWGEPSYLVKKGSTIRIDWKPKAPEQYAIYFKCTSKLVTTFKEVYGDDFKYEKTRAILFGLKERVPKRKLKKCINAALSYHTVKNEALLGIS